MILFRGVELRSWFESHKDGNVSAAKSCVFPEQDRERKGDQFGVTEESSSAAGRSYYIILIMETESHLSVFIWTLEKFSIILA